MLKWTDAGLSSGPGSTIKKTGGWKNSHNIRASVPPPVKAVTVTLVSERRHCDQRTWPALGVPLTMKVLRSHFMSRNSSVPIGRPACIPKSLHRAMTTIREVLFASMGHHSRCSVGPWLPGTGFQK